MVRHKMSSCNSILPIDVFYIHHTDMKKVMWELEEITKEDIKNFLDDPEKEVIKKKE